LGAPGVDVASTFLDTVPPFAQFVFDSGTSMATPMVTGVAALVAAQNPTWTAQQLRARILATTRPDPALAGKTVSGGVVDLRRALFAPRVALDPVSDSGSSSSDRLTNAASLMFDITFPLPVTGLTSGDFTVGGTATGCSVAAPTGSGVSYKVLLTDCSA